MRLTMTRAVNGFCGLAIHSAKILRLSVDLPIIVEIVDTIEKIEAFLPVIDTAIGEDATTSSLDRIAFLLLLVFLGFSVLVWRAWRLREDRQP